MTVEDLIAIHEITQMKYRYMRAVDTQDWVLLATVFTKNARSWYDSGSLAATSGEAIVGMLSSAMKSSTYSSHTAVHPEISLISATTAKGIWRFEDIVHCGDGDTSLEMAGIKGGERLIGAGYYYDEYEKEDGAWKISSIGYVRLFDSTESPKDTPNARKRFDKARGRLSN